VETYDEFFLSSGFFFAACEPFVDANKLRLSKTDNVPNEYMEI
jgi:hypothetical protein